MAAAERLTVFGTSAKWLALAEKEGLRPIETHDLERAASDTFHRKSAGAAQLRLCTRSEARRTVEQHQRRHGHHLLLCRR
jgi:hypothetical protein